VAYKQAGNGVNVGVVQFVASQLFESAGVPWGADLAERIRLTKETDPVDVVLEDDSDEDEDAA